LGERVVERCGRRLPWTNNVVFVAKASGAIRVCIDCTPANKVTADFDWPLPRLQDLRHHIRGRKWFTRLDLVSAFFRITVPEKYRWLTAYTSEGTDYQFRKMPFGLKTAPAVFQRFMDHILAECKNYAWCYMDDILISATTRNELRRRQDKVLEILKRAGCTVNQEKSEYERQSLLFAGMWIFSNGVGPNFKKLRDVLNLECPTTKPEKQSALGLVSYLRDHIPLASHLTAELYPGKGTLLSDDEYEAAWHRLCQHIAHAACTLGHWQDDVDAQLYTDASKRAIGIILIQDRRIIALGSRKLTTAEAKYSTTDRERLGLVYATQKFRLFLHRRKGTTEVFSDHKALLSPKGDKDMPRQARWIELVKYWIPNLKHVKGKDNPADYLSRWDVSGFGGQIKTT
jgi:hypothetical protein